MTIGVIGPLISRFFLDPYYSKRDIPVANYRMHTLHCSRNVVLCPECQEPVPRSGLEDHREEEHAQRECELCKEMVAPKDVRDHKVRQKKSQ